MNWTDSRKRRVRRRRARIASGFLAGALAVLFTAGLFLPAEHTEISRAVVRRPPETVWRVLTDLDGMPLWRSDVTAVERLPDLMGKPAWREIGRHGARVVEASQAEPPRRLVIQGATEGEPSLPIRTFELVSTADGTEVTVTERIASRNPFRRVLVRLSLPRPAIERLLRDLARRLSINPRQVATE
jgi:uncharacterized protein YndB with AHSA1/START domain